MLTNKIFLKKTKKGSILKIVREHYLRDDISCGSECCETCTHDSKGAKLLSKPENNSVIVNTPHYIIPDSNVVFHQIDVLEDAAIQNLIILQTVLEEVKHRSAPAYKRLKDILANPAKHSYSFANEFNKDTYIERAPGEKANDRNDRAIREAGLWYQKHLSCTGITTTVVLVTNDADNRAKANLKGLTAFTIQEYIKSLKDNGSLLDKLAHVGTSMVVEKDKVQFPEHLSLAEIQKGIRTGKYLQGTFLASRENYLEANVSVHNQEKMVFLQGHANLNRAVNDDVVAIEMLPEPEWSCPSSLMLEEIEEKPDDADIEAEDAAVKRKRVPRELRQPTGRVVGIIKRNWRQYCGILQPSAVKEATRHLFMPAERRIPKIRIETRQARDLGSQRIVVAIDSWPRNSRYPQGHFVRKLGNIGDKDTENEVLLLEHDVPHCSFSEQVLSFLPKMPWTITDEDLKHRTDLRHVTICSVDPPGCTDIDDALHCRDLPNGNLEVGVHIADVSHFIRPGNALDREAASRGTTVYLVDKRIDMVPELLSSNLCSLICDVDRFAFTVIWEMTQTADIVKTSFMKSVIQSRASLTYGEAQMIIDDPKRNDEIARSLRGLNRLAKIMKQRRIDKGALTLASPEIRFHIDSETHDPIDVQAKQLLDTNSMVEEFMLLANIATAQKIQEEFPNCAVLRRHPSPPVSNFEPLMKAALSKGFKMNVSRGKDLADSLETATIPDDPYFNTMLRIMTTRCMMQAVYFCSGMIPESDFLHYGLATEIYTHFTSPIRRYSDILVHRLLAVSIGADSSYPDLLDKHRTQIVCNNLNYRHKMAQYAGRASVNLHTHLFFKNRSVDEEGYILFVRKNAVQVLIPKYGLEATLYLNSEKSKKGPPFIFNEEENTQACAGVTLKVFDRIIVQISIDRSNVQHLKLRIQLVEPVRSTNVLKA
ncbi:exosome complex exonuclease RRP44-like isoform X2 [Dreissena polymorpha]|uniref:exosome complex exonuclease RRP44-like isoform X2 n=1 Tax=Dreissena polymorpha TaxID=45954 RepID=UPI002265328A|nr:exosome complex exonuclease RRP44-like isoform X2 [Dreissena polymorpha]